MQAETLGITYFIVSFGLKAKFLASSGLITLAMHDLGLGLDLLHGLSVKLTSSSLEAKTLASPSPQDQYFGLGLRTKFGFDLGLGVEANMFCLG